MTRIYTEGFEMGDKLTGWLDIVAGSMCSGASGNWGYDFRDGRYYFDDTYSEWYFKGRFRNYNNGWANQEYYISFYGGSTMVVRLHSTGSCYRISTAVATYDTSVLIATTYYKLIEIYAKLHDTEGRLVLRIEGKDEVDFTGDTLGTVGYMNRMYIRNNTAVGHYWWDDFAVNDTSGSYDNSWIGPTRIYRLAPNANGVLNNWMGSDGNKINNYELVDDFAKDSDTTYIVTSGSNHGLRDQYGVSTYDLTQKVVSRIYPEARARKTATPEEGIKLGIMSSGSTYETSGSTTLGFQYDRVRGDEYILDPATNEAWLQDAIDSVELVVEVA